MGFVTAEWCIDILCGNLEEPMLQMGPGDNYTFQQNNDPKYIEKKKIILAIDPHKTHGLATSESHFEPNSKSLGYPPQQCGPNRCNKRTSLFCSFAEGLGRFGPTISLKLR